MKIKLKDKKMESLPNCWVLWCIENNWDALQ